MKLEISAGTTPFRNAHLAGVMQGNHLLALEAGYQTTEPESLQASDQGEQVKGTTQNHHPEARGQGVGVTERNPPAPACRLSRYEKENQRC